MHTWFLSIMTVVVLFCRLALADQIISSPADLSSIQAPRDAPKGNGDLILLDTPLFLGDAYDLPINTETHPSIGRAIDGPGRAHIDFRICKGQPLDRNLDELVRLNNNLVDYRIIHNQLCVLPVKEKEDEILSNLDVRVSLELAEASVWDAVKIITREVNKQRATPFPLGSYPVEWIKMRQPFPELTDLKEITLSLSCVAAREALCAVFAASSLKLAYRYHTGSRNDELIICTYKQGRPIEGSETLTPEGFEWWKKEVGWAKGRWIPLGFDRPLDSTKDLTTCIK
jgi:hypothetical protein